MLPDGNGLDRVEQLTAEYPGLPVIVFSARNTLTTAVRATEVGAYDYLPKPFDLDVLARAVQGALARGPGAPEERLDEVDAALPLIGRSPAMQDVYRIIARVVSNDLTVLISGRDRAPARNWSPARSTISARAAARPSLRSTWRRSRAS